ncbi:hypothetical protein HAX54_011788 [Datura stramonium]|uniref:Uncharacterized protein n=1 Tax=Datura stramonium TaxID=4076 RepID=A0ABS8Y537_DATST|nr:hypothetical protein [Datura stramonium]
MVFSSDERPSVKMKLVNIWNSKLQTQGECTSTRDGESKEEFALTKTRNDGLFSFHCEMQSSTGTENLKNQDTILNVASGILHFVGDLLVPDTIDKSCLEGAKVLQQDDKKFIPIVASTTLAIIDQMSEFVWKSCLRRQLLAKNSLMCHFNLESVMPEIGYHHYTTMLIKLKLGLICNIHSQASRSLLTRQPTPVTLIALTFSNTWLYRINSREANGYRKVLKTTSVCTLKLMIVDKMLLKEGLAFSERVSGQKKSPLCILCLVQNCWCLKGSADDLLCTRSPFSVPLLSHGFGIHLSSVNKLNASDGSFKLSGYISGPDVYQVKVLQDFCIHLFQYIS